MSALGFASDITDANWKKLLIANKFDSNEQSYCYRDSQGVNQGVNVDKKIRLASVSKLMVSLWSIHNLKLDYKYKTKLYIVGSHLHIAGTRDPYLGQEKMFFLISQLNDLGFVHFDKITFDSNFIIDPSEDSAHGNFPKINPSIIANLTKEYFNTTKWDIEKKNSYNSIVANDKKNRFRKKVFFDVNEVAFSDSNPHIDNPNTRELTLSSPELFRYLKQMNIDSNNFVAEMIFQALGGVASFENFMSDQYNLDMGHIHFYTGSGLPYFENNIRYDNYSTCSVVLNLISSLKDEIENQSRELEDVIAVPGSDAGTFRNRVFPMEFKNAFVAKTGTLAHTSTLAGALSTRTGFSFFGIFNQTSDIKSAKVVQNSMVSSIMNDLGGPKAFDYVVEDFHTYNNENIKSFLGSIKSEDSFTSIEENLY